MCTKNTKITIALVNFETTALTNACIKSIIKHVKMYDYDIILLDNSRIQNKFVLNTDINKNIKIIDNTTQAYVNFDKIISALNIKNTKSIAAFKHSCSIHFLINICITDILVILDSDALLYRDLDFIDDTFITCADIQQQWISPLTKDIRYTRFIPFIQAFNVKLMKKYNINYFCPNHIIGGNSSQSIHYDTGSFFYEQVVSKFKLPYKKIHFPLYVKHLSAGSEHNDNKKTLNFLNVNLSCYKNIDVNVIVSLTSHKPRYSSLVKAISSIENQKFNGNYEIFLVLCNKDLDDLPISLKFYIARSKIKILYASSNIKSHKKYFYTMLNYKTIPIITVDDDCIYSPTLIQKLYDEYKNDQKYILAFRTHKMTYNANKQILPYSKWKQKIFENTPSHDLFATGIGGVLYPPDCLHISNDDLNMINDYINNDDFFLKIKEIQNNIKVKSVIFDKNKIYPFNELDIGHDKTSLYFGQNLHGGNDMLIQKMNALHIIS